MIQKTIKRTSLFAAILVTGSVALASEAYWQPMYERSEVCSSAEGQMGIMEAAEEVVEKVFLRTDFSSDCIQDRLEAMGYWTNTEYRRVRLSSNQEVDLICQVFTSHVIRCD